MVGTIKNMVYLRSDHKPWFLWLWFYATLVQVKTRRGYAAPQPATSPVALGAEIQSAQLDDEVELVVTEQFVAEFLDVVGDDEFERFSSWQTTPSELERQEMGTREEFEGIESDQGRTCFTFPGQQIRSKPVGNMHTVVRMNMLCFPFWGS
jgi:hypothetical protein